MRNLPAVGFTVAVWLLAAGCTAHNPNFAGDGGAAEDLAGSAGADLAGVMLDLAGPMGSCMAGQRKCAGTQASDRCEAGMFVVDRNCPNASSCMSTYCAPPLPQIGTQVGERCDNTGPQQVACSASTSQNLSCQPFVDPSSKDLRWFCDKPVGTGVAGTLCTRGSDCRSGFCGGNGTCFEACQFSSLSPGNCMLRCQSVSLVVEGVQQTVKSCIP